PRPPDHTSLSKDVAVLTATNSTPLQILIISVFLFDATATPEICTLSLHDALPIYQESLLSRRVRDGERAAVSRLVGVARLRLDEDRKSTRLNSSHVAISYAVFCLKKKIERRHRLSSAASRDCCDGPVEVGRKLLQE